MTAATKAPPSLIALAAKFASAKAAEDTAKAKRIEIEEAIIALVGFRRPEGQETFEAESAAGSSVKFVLKQPITTSFNESGWPDVKKDLSAEARKAVRTKYELDTKVARLIQEHDPESWKKISVLVTRKPGKVSVSMEMMVLAEGEGLAALGAGLKESV